MITHSYSDNIQLCLTQLFQSESLALCQDSHTYDSDVRQGQQSSISAEESARSPLSL